MIDETYNEVWKLLNNIPLRDYLKIPKKEISEILKNKIPNYSDRKISEENIISVKTDYRNSVWSRNNQSGKNNRNE